VSQFSVLPFLPTLTVKGSLEEARSLYLRVNAMWLDVGMCGLVCSSVPSTWFITNSSVALCNLSLTTRRETDYARDRIWEKDPYNFDDCVAEDSDPYVVYAFGSDYASVTWGREDDVRYC
jgi:hypothetical protein